MAHLLTGAVSGGIDRWPPYLVSFSLDLLSLQLLKGNNLTCQLGTDNLLALVHKANVNDALEEMWNWSERLEIQKRYLSLLMYLLRSPFYDRYTKQRLLRLLSVFATYVPLFGRLVKPFIAYLPEWQRVYFYTWTQ